MKTYVILMRGINVGGKNKIPMAELKLFLEEQGFENVVTYIQRLTAPISKYEDAPGSLPGASLSDSKRPFTSMSLFKPS